MSRSRLSWNRTFQLLLFLISLAFLLNSFLVFITIHGQQQKRNQEGSLHGLLRLGERSKYYENEDQWWKFHHDKSPLVSSLMINRITESEYWHRMLQQDVLNTSECCKNTTTATTTATASTSFLGDIRIHVQQHPNAPACLPPPTKPQCHETNYSVVLYCYRDIHYESIQFDDDDRVLVRPLVTRIMALLAYPSVQEIHLIVSSDVAARWGAGRGSTKQLTIGKYGQRMQQWEDQGKIHRYATTTTKTLWDVVSTIANSIQTQSVLWLDAAPSKKWNGTMLKSQLQYWRRHPDVMTVQRSVDIRHNLQQPQHICHVPSLHGLMMHRHHLCLLSHPVVKMFVQKHSKLWLEERNVATTVAMSLVLLHASPLTDLWYVMTATNHMDDDASHDDDTIMSISPSTSSLLLEYFGCPCIPDTITNDKNDVALVNEVPCLDNSVDIVNQYIPKQQTYNNA
jgi:hypothetical protein